jgi:hypothetical protein
MPAHAFVATWFSCSLTCLVMWQKLCGRDGWALSPPATSFLIVAELLAGACGSLQELAGTCRKACLGEVK